MNGPSNYADFLPPDTSQPQEQLAHILPALWRTLVRATKATQETPALDSQMAMLRRLTTLGPLSPAALAGELHLARPTVSNMLKEMLADQLVERRPSPADGRSVEIRITPRGTEVLEGFRNDRIAVIAEALAALDEDQREAIVRAVAPLRELLEQFDRVATAGAANPETRAVATP